MKTFKEYARWIAFEFLTRVVMEFIWLLFAMSLGVVMTSRVLNLPFEQVLEAVKSMRTFLVMILFNAAAVRIVLYFGLNWLDKKTDQYVEEQKSTLSAIKTGIKLAINNLKGDK